MTGYAKERGVFLTPTLPDLEALARVLTIYYSRAGIDVFHFPCFKSYLIKFVLKSAFSQLFAVSSTR